MEVEAAGGDLGEGDVTPPKVAEIKRDRRGKLRTLMVRKGLIFKKEIAVPADRIQQVERTPAHEAAEEAPEDEGDDGSGKVTIDAGAREIDALGAGGKDRLAHERVARRRGDLIGEVEETLPTTEGLRRKEVASAARGRPRLEDEGQDARNDEQAEAGTQTRARFSLRSLGPGFLSGMAGNDSTAVTSYSVNGATNGYGQLWLMLISTPLFQAVQYACAKMGRVTQQGFSELLREHYGRTVAAAASLVLILANLALIAGDLVAVGSGLELITGIVWQWFVVPVAAALWYLTVYQNFGTIKRVFLVMSLAFAAYLITGIVAHPDWGRVLAGTLVPHVGLDFASISSAVALLGATVSPYTMFWQAQGEKEERRPGRPKQQFHLAALDIAAGTVSGNVVAYFIIVSTAATLFAHHRSIATAADAARSLEPLLGPFAKYLFAVGLIGAGVVAIPVLLASTSYAVAGTFGWAASLWKKPWQSEGFYLILTVALAASLIVALLGVNPIGLMFGANVLQGILSPVLVIFLIIVGNNRRIMKKHRLGALTNICLVVTALLMSAAAMLFFYGLLTGHGG
jgi:NRAMP (natural resistance-associated macrophage protein)-like metal ion transporter